MTTTDPTPETVVPAPNATITAFHNLDGALWKYTPGNRIVLVYRGEMTGVVNHQVICERVFTLLNVGDDPEITDPPDPSAVEYRTRGNRPVDRTELRDGTPQQGRGALP